MLTQFSLYALENYINVCTPYKILATVSPLRESKDSRHKTTFDRSTQNDLIEITTFEFKDGSFMSMKNMQWP